MERKTASVRKDLLDKVKEESKKLPVSGQQLLDFVVTLGLEELQERSEISIPLERDEEIERRR